MDVRYVLSLSAYDTLGCQTTKFWSSFIVADTIITELLANNHRSSSVAHTIPDNVASFMRLPWFSA